MSGSSCLTCREFPHQTTTGHWLHCKQPEKWLLRIFPSHKATAMYHTQRRGSDICKLCFFFIRQYSTWILLGAIWYVFLPSMFLFCNYRQPQHSNTSCYHLVFSPQLRLTVQAIWTPFIQQRQHFVQTGQSLTIHFEYS